ncbi:MAG: hypothetical protein LBE51_08755 [Acidovorax sp.]|jgi:uncharacterized protein YacL|nr:hypothetical protein [Acidovorax sp.]
MNNQKSQSEQHSLAPFPLGRRSNSLAQSQAICLGGAGASLATLLVALQLAAGRATDAHEIAIAFSGGAMLVWITLWLMNDAYVYWAEKGVECSQEKSWLNLRVTLFGLATGALLAALFHLILSASVIASCIFFVSALMLVALSVLHYRAVRRVAELHSPEGADLSR